MPGCFIFRRSRRRCGYGQECRGKCGNCSFSFPTAPTARFSFDSFSPFGCRLPPRAASQGAYPLGRAVARSTTGRLFPPPPARLATAGEEEAARGSERVGRAGGPGADQAGHGLRVLPAAARCVLAKEIFGWVAPSLVLWRLSHSSPASPSARGGAEQERSGARERCRNEGGRRGGGTAGLETEAPGSEISRYCLSGHGAGSGSPAAPKDFLPPPSQGAVGRGKAQGRGSGGAVTERGGRLESLGLSPRSACDCSCRLFCSPESSRM